MPRPPLLEVPLSAEELAALDELKRRAALASDSDLVRLALWRLAAFYDLGLPRELFSIGGPRRAAKKPSAKRAKRPPAGSSYRS